MVSRVGAQVTLIALPLTAIQLHQAGSLETGFLLACGRAPYLLVGPLAGVFADRFSHRILLITANWIMALTLATVPVSALLIGYVGMPHLYTVATLMGGLTVIADVAFLACVPTVVPPQQLVQAQSWIELGQSAALVLGPPLAGWLIYSLSAPIAILADAASFLLVTALLSYVIIAPTTSASMTSDYNHDDTRSILERVLSEAAEGALFVLRTPKLRAITFATGTLIFWYSAYSAVFLLYLTEGLGLNATTIGTVSGIAAIGSVIGTLLARPFARTLGLGRVLNSSAPHQCRWRNANPAARSARMACIGTVAICIVDRQTGLQRPSGTNPLRLGSAATARPCKRKHPDHSVGPCSSRSRVRRRLWNMARRPRDVTA
ncbi:MFS transporter [Cupriavidus taiwanensis]|nr:MFS transporter [Cupriavidus taiwanensis]